MKAPAVILGALVMSGCAASHVDHFYVIDAAPGGARESSVAFTRQVTLRVSVPSLVDRAAMVISTPDGVAVLEHERWAAPLSDLITSALARDIERQRSDVVVLPHPFDKAGVPLTAIAIDVDEVRARLGDQVSIEAHWRISDAAGGKVTLGRDVFVSPAHSQSYAAVADGLSAAVGLLADRLIKEIPTQ
jgi:uncharacterized protein